MMRPRPLDEALAAIMGRLGTVLLLLAWAFMAGALLARLMGHGGG